MPAARGIYCTERGCGMQNGMEKHSKQSTLPAARQHRTMTPAALEANRANAKKAGRPKGGMNADKLELSARCRVNDERHIKILERIAQFSPNESYQLTAIRDLMDRGHGRPRQAIEGSGPGGAIPFQVFCRSHFVTTTTIS
jgi:hypothetical protein